jgi:hypothetical protein
MPGSLLMLGTPSTMIERRMIKGEFDSAVIGLLKYD